MRYYLSSTWVGYGKRVAGPLAPPPKMAIVSKRPKWSRRFFICSLFFSSFSVFICLCIIIFWFFWPFVVLIGFRLSESVYSTRYRPRQNLTYDTARPVATTFQSSGS